MTAILWRKPAGLEITIPAVPTAARMKTKTIRIKGTRFFKKATSLRAS
jgi:hypothetical protein